MSTFFVCKLPLQNRTRFRILCLPALWLLCSSPVESCTKLLMLNVFNLELHAASGITFYASACLCSFPRLSPSSNLSVWALFSMGKSNHAPSPALLPTISRSSWACLVRSGKLISTVFSVVFQHPSALFAATSVCVCHWSPVPRSLLMTTHTVGGVAASLLVFVRRAGTFSERCVPVIRWMSAKVCRSQQALFWGHRARGTLTKLLWASLKLLLPIDGSCRQCSLDGT